MAFTTLVLTSPHTTGQNVADAQWLLSKNNVFKGAYYTGPLDSVYGPLTAAGTQRGKFWLGYPDAEINTVFGEKFHNLLTGVNPLPLTYALRRKSRLAAQAKAIEEATLRFRAMT